MNHVVLIGAGAAVVLIAVMLILFQRRTSERESQKAHETAQQRAPPVEIGETYELGITEFTDHHSGSRVGVGKVEGFVIFVDEIPDSVSVGDAVKARVMSFNSGRTSADATFLERA